METKPCLKSSVGQHYYVFEFRSTVIGILLHPVGTPNVLDTAAWSAALHV